MDNETNPLSGDAQCTECGKAYKQVGEKSYEAQCYCFEIYHTRDVMRGMAKRIEAQEEEIARLREAYSILRSATSHHSAHWDPTMRHGAGCEECQRFKFGYAPVTSSWSGTGPRWFRGEKNMAHAKCADKVRDD